MPFQVSDNLGNMLAVREATLAEIINSQIVAVGYLRPMLWVNLKVVFDLAGGHYFAVFRALHAGLVLAALFLFVRLLRVRTPVDLAAAGAAAVVLVGLHTFGGLVLEANPINTFLLIAVCCLAAVNLSTLRPAWWIDVLAALLFAVAAMSVETGLLVWVCFVAAYLAGLRGVSWRGVALVTLLLGVYFYLRFGPLAVGAPGLIERSTGFGFGTLEPDQLISRFGGNPLGFYTYNVVSALIGVLVSEPRSGVWDLTREVVGGGTVPRWMLVHVASSVLTTALVVTFVVRRARRWRRWDLEHEDRLVFVFVAVLGANAVISYPYTKDVVMSPAGVLYPVAVYVAVRGALLSTTRAGWRAALAGMLLVVSSLWAVRVVDLGHGMRLEAFKNRTDWAYVDEWLADQSIELETPDERRFVRQLQDEMIGMRVPSAHFLRHRAEEYFEFQ